MYCFSLSLLLLLSLSGPTLDGLQLNIKMFYPNVPAVFFCRGGEPEGTSFGTHMIMHLLESSRVWWVGGSDNANGNTIIQLKYQLTTYKDWFVPTLFSL